MGAQLRVVLDQLARVVDADQAAAALALTAGLVTTAPQGCTVEAIVPGDATESVRGVAGAHRLGLGRRELSLTWPLGIVSGVGGGLIHAPTLMAPLVRHDRQHDLSQTAVTLWDLRAWEDPAALPKTTVVWQRAMLRRAVRHADAVVVPSHAIADRLGELAPLGERVRVIAGAVADDFRIPLDGDQRRRALGLPERYIALTGAGEQLLPGLRAAAAASLDAVVLDVPGGDETRGASWAADAGLGRDRLHLCGALAQNDRAAVVGGAAALVATGTGAAWPWRTVEALALGVPVVAIDGGVHRDVIAEGGMLVSAAEVAEAVTDAVAEGTARLAVRASDRSRAFSWLSSAERIWALHADL